LVKLPAEETTMNRTTQLLFALIALMVSGCSKQSQVQPTATGSRPNVVQAAAPAAPEAPATPPQPAARVQAAAPDKPNDPAQEWCERVAQAILTVAKKKSADTDTVLSTKANFSRSIGNYCEVELIAKTNGGKTYANGTDEYTVFAMGVKDETPEVVIRAKATGVNRGDGGEYYGYAGFGNRIAVDGNTKQDYERAFNTINGMMGRE
jgi:hypothetical protein